MKTLFAHSGNVCAFSDTASRVGACEEKLTDPSWEKTKAIICHIYGRNPGSARYDESMTDEQRDAYDNLIVMCPNCSKMIDDLQPSLYPPEKLQEMKARHEQRHGSGSGWNPGEDELARYAADAIAFSVAWLEARERRHRIRPIQTAVDSGEPPSETHTVSVDDAAGGRSEVSDTTYGDGTYGSGTFGADRDNS